MVFSAYALKGRILPAIFSIILPIMVFNHFFVSEEFAKFVGGVLGAKIISNLTISGVCLYFLSETGRLFGKNVFERAYFKEESQMPTTTFMMFGDKTYSDDYKNKFRDKVSHDFNIKLPTKKEETKDENSARTRIVETMALIRKKLHKNSFLLQHNIEYGAMRNVIGGAVLGICFSIINIVFFSTYVKIYLAVLISICTLLTYLMLIAFSKVIIGFYGKNYAKVLFREYIG